MERLAVESSSLASVGYDDASMTFEVEFANGTVYQYFDVPADVVRELFSAPSIGRRFAATIRNAGFRFKKVK